MSSTHPPRVGAKIAAVGPFGGIGIGPLNANAQAEPVEKDGARQVAGFEEARTMAAMREKIALKSTW